MIKNINSMNVEVTLVNLFQGQAVLIRQMKHS